MRNIPGILITILILQVSGPVFSQVFVAPYGDDENPGSRSSPKRTIQSAAGLLGAGDTLFLREGTYHESVVLNGLKGTADQPVVIMAYPGETVSMDGTVDLDEIKVPGATWELATERFPGTGNIYRLRVKEQVWQLFAEQPGLMTTPNAVGGELGDYRMQVVARWPNTSTHPCDPAERLPGSTEIVPGNWWSFRSTWADASAEGTTFNTIECAPSLNSLATTGRSFEGGTAILSVISQGPANIAVGILAHEAGSNFITHTGTDSAYAYHRERHFIVEHLNALDRPGEWYFEDSTLSVYLWPEDNQDPNGKKVRGRNLNRVFDLENSRHIRFEGLGLFASTVRLDGEDISFKDCAISYPDMPRRVLGIHDDAGPAIDARTCGYFGMKNCVVEYSQYHIIEVKNVGSVFDNNYFHHLGMMGMGTTGCFMGVNTFTRNTLQTIGHRAAVKANSQPESGRNQSWNILDGWGYLYANDGVGFQTNQASSVGSVRSYNWFIRSEKPGHRYDGPDEGKGFPTLGLSHHLVGLRTKSTSTNIKGDYNRVYHYLDVLGSSEHGGIAIRWNIETGEGNAHTVMRNCAADGINIGKWDPLPCIHSNNYDASRRGGSMLEMIPAADLLDFRPKFNSPLVNNGYEVPGINDDFLGPAPDIGAYEWGDDTYWIPGYRQASTSMPIPFDGARDMPLDRDLIFLHAYESGEAIFYFGINESAVLNADTSNSLAPAEGDPDGGDVLFLKLDRGRNIVTPTMLNGNPSGFDPAPYLLVDDPAVGLSANRTYYWRADAVKADGKVVEGELWSFATGSQTHYVKHRIMGKREGIVSPLAGAWVHINGDSIATDSTGNTYGLRLSQGNYDFRIRKKGYLSSCGSLPLAKDTLIIDTLDHTTYDVTFILVDRDTEMMIPGAILHFNDTTLVTGSAGTVSLQQIEYASYSLVVTADNYLPVEDTILEIYSDTTFHIRMIPHYLQADMKIVDRVSGEPLERALVYYYDQLKSTNDRGEVTLGQLRKGKLIYTIKHADYFPHTDSVVMERDTSLEVLMTSKTADIRFVISDGAEPVFGAEVLLNGALKASSDMDGSVRFFNKLARENYWYSVVSEGFETVQDSLFLETDTLVDVILQPLTTGMAGQFWNEFRIYPNPASHRLTLDCGGEVAAVRVLDMEGRVRIHHSHPGASLNISPLEPGAYIVELELGTGERVFHVIEKTGL